MERTAYDYIVVGGGTTGSVVAARLAQDRDCSVCLLEAGPSDEGVAEILELRRWQELLGNPDYGFEFGIEPQERGNSDIRHSRAIMLGGCSSHNSSIAFIPTEGDMRRWEEAGAKGWGPDGVAACFSRVSRKVNMETSEWDNPLVKAFLSAARERGFPELDFARGVREGAGLFRLNKKGGLRQSASVTYLHPLSSIPRNLTVLTGTRASRLLFENGHAVGVETNRGELRASREVILSCGAFDTPKLLMLSGVGAASALERLGMPVVADVPGVGENLLDHPEGVIMWESKREIPQQTANYYEAGLFAKVDADSDDPDLMFHFGTEPFDMHTLPKGYPTSERAFSITPNVTRARSRGTVRLRSADPDEPPAIDFHYFTDPEGYDERIMVEGVRLARELADTGALSEWVQRELAPGPSARSFEEISEYVRTTANTVYHPAGTAKMGAPDDPYAVVDPELRVRGVERLRVADASVFPVMISVNPAITCMMIGEKAADLIQHPS